jgi:hypothetical protein
MLALAMVVGATMVYAPPAAAATPDCNPQDNKFLGIIPPWYEYLDSTYNAKSGQCDIGIGQSSTTDLSTGKYWLIGLAIIDILVRVAGFVAVIFVIYGGVRYITSSGEPENTKAARETIINALIGVIIALIAVPVVSYVGNSLGTTDVNGVPQSNVSIQDLFDMAYKIIGAIAVLMIVIAGFKYIISNGDPQSMGRAKDTILYTLIGALVVLVATGIIDFVVTKF